MQHVNLSSIWQYSTEPFPAFRAALAFGRNQRDAALLPAKLAPVVQYTVRGLSPRFGEQGPELLSSTDKNEVDSFLAERKPRIAELQRQYAAAVAWSEQNHLRDEIMALYTSMTASAPTLPDNSFRVIRTRGKGTIIVVPGEDTSRRCLLMVDGKGGFRGSVGMHCDGQVIAKCSAANACESACTVAALLEPGQSVRFHATGRSVDRYDVYTWDGTSVQTARYSAAEWAARDLPDEGDAL